MSIATAKRTLNRAFVELAQANGDIKAKRQAGPALPFASCRLRPSTRLPQRERR